MPHLSLILLGTFQAHLDGQSVTGFQSDKARALLAYLAVEAAQPHRRDRLAGLLWPEWPDSNARANLRHALNNLRSILRDREAKPSFLLSDRQTIQVNLESDCRLDVAEFRRYLTYLTDVEAGRASERAVQALQQAVELYKGPFLSGFFLEDCAEFEEWSLLTRERLQHRILATLDVLARHFEQTGGLKDAVRYARRQVEIDALQEDAHRHLMRLLARDGQRSAALVQFETIRQLLADELGVDPSAETLELHLQIQSGRLEPQTKQVAPPLPSPQAAAPRHNLPAQTTRFIGRTVELAAVRDKLLQPDVRLLTLTGPGGTGKTRLALQAAADVLDHFADGVYFVSLAPIRDPEWVVSTIAETIGVRESGDRPVLELLREAVQGRQLLLVLDNFEHVIPAGPPVAELLVVAPRLKILVTSRFLLQLYGEHSYAVLPLPLPDLHARQSLDRLLENEACQLFADRAQAIKPDFVLTTENSQTVAEICTGLDGLPLAIELAAARIRLLPPLELLGQLNRRLQFLTKGGRNLPARHQTLRDTIAWSYELLAPEEQLLFQRLAVFVGSCSLEAAEVVGNISGQIDVLTGLESLMDKSLLRQTEVVGKPRFVMLETIREYGLECLQQSGEKPLTYQAYVNYYVGWVETTTQALKDDGQETWLAQLEMEHDNLRAALRWTRNQKNVEAGLRLVGGLWRFWEMRAYISEGRQRLEEALSGSEATAPALRAEAHTGAGTMAFKQSDDQHATLHHEAALALYRQLGDEAGMAFALNNLGVQANNQGDYERATRFYEESLVLSRKAGDKSVMNYVLNNLGEAARRQRHYERAAALYEEALLLSRELDEKWQILYPLVNLGNVGRHLGHYEQAAVYLKEALMRSRELGFQEAIAECLERYADLAVDQARPERAGRLWAAAEVIREAIGVPITLADRDEYDRNVALAYDALGETAFAAAWAAGRAMTWEEAASYALGEVGL